MKDYEQPDASASHDSRLRRHSPGLASVILLSLKGPGVLILGTGEHVGLKDLPTLSFGRYVSSQDVATYISGRASQQLGFVVPCPSVLSEGMWGGRRVFQLVGLYDRPVGELKPNWENDNGQLAPLNEMHLKLFLHECSRGLHRSILHALVHIAEFDGGLHKPALREVTNGLARSLGRKPPIVIAVMHPNSYAAKKKEKQKEQQKEKRRHWNQL
jgi:hypothetical protein